MLPPALDHTITCPLLHCTWWACSVCGDLTAACIPCEDPDGRCEGCVDEGRN